LSADETEKVLACIRENEQSTSGEIRLMIESRCSHPNPMDRVKELFYSLKMYETHDRNGVLIYIAHQDKKFALFGDKAIADKLDPAFWETERNRLADSFRKQEFSKGITEYIQQVGALLRLHFPWEGEKKNELPDEIVFGK